MIFLQQSPGVSSFDIYRPSWEFLKDSPKFMSITRALTSSSNANVEVTPLPTDSTSGRPPGTKATKRKMEEERIVDSVKASLKGTVLQSGGSKNSSSELLAAAFGHFAGMINTGIERWTERAAYSNADPELQRRFDNLVLLRRISEMEAMHGRDGTKPESLITAVNAEGGTNNNFSSGMSGTQVSIESTNNNFSRGTAPEKAHNNFSRGTAPEKTHNNFSRGTAPEKTPDPDAVRSRKLLLLARRNNLLSTSANDEPSQIITFGNDEDSLRF
jgi:hypothetical protein